jgi:hypothetical protein
MVKSTLEEKYGISSLFESEIFLLSEAPAPRREDKDGTSYIGDWNGLKEGIGKQIWPDGSFYEGQWQGDLAHGKGKLVTVENGVYDGQWVNGKACGQGRFRSESGVVYEGEWLDDK